jgi:hypothetical protein
LISTDDEAFTYNNRVNSIAIIQEHKMILKAIENGVSEEMIAKSLNVDVASIGRRWKLPDGICAEAAELLKGKAHCAEYIFGAQKTGADRADRGCRINGCDEQFFK